jgi:thiol-disulfide isomerase/thioredoxin
MMDPMNRRLLAALTAAPLLLLTGCSGTAAVDATGAGEYEFGRLATGPDGLFPVGDRRPAPPLTGTTLQGEPLDTGSLRGSVVVLNFWADWCGPCRAEAPFLKRVAEDTADEGVRFVGVNVKNDRDAALAFERVSGTPYPSLYDQPGALLLAFREVVPQTPPSTMLIDRAGRLAGIFYGGVTERELAPPVRLLAAEQ